MKPLVGITTYEKTEVYGIQMLLESVTIHSYYARAVESSGGLPVMLHSQGDAALAEEYAERLDALVLSGGFEAITPLLYQQAISKHTEWVNPLRDAWELELIEAFSRKDKPILGICRGNQLINVSRGGTLYDNLSLQFDSPYGHNGGTSMIDQPVHYVNLLEGAPLKEIFGEERLSVNSLHSQAVKDLGSGLEVSAMSDDGVIEGIYDPNKRFFQGVQWHPEMMASSREEMLKIFRALIDAV